MRRMKLVLAIAAVLVAMLAATAGPAMADNNNRHENRWDRWEDRHHGDCDWFNCHRGDHIDLDLDEAFFLFPLFAVEEIDIDCDGVDDDWDGGIDEGADCEVEIEFFEWWD
jgi:hypothetical protein